MNAYPQCIPCLINQGLNAVRKLNLDKKIEKEIAVRSLKLLSKFDSFDKSPAYYAYFIQQIVKDITGKEDPFYAQKKLANRIALDLLKEIKPMRNSQEDSLAFSLKVSAVGNYIDFAIRGDFDLRRDVLNLMNSEFVVWDYETFKKKLKGAERVFIIGDNAGEIAFDKILVEELLSMGKEVLYGVKGKPILNDATYEDAEEVSMTKLCKVIDNGSDKVGTWLEDCSEEFRNTFYASDLVISKGQANFETLSDANREVFFLLVAKCEPIASETGGKVRRFVFKFKGG